MKVYVLIKGWEYEGENICQIFDSKEKADKAKEKADHDNKNRGCYFEVEEFDVE